MAVHRSIDRMRDTRLTCDPVRDEIRTFVATTFRDGRADGLDPTTPLVTSGIVDSAGVFEVVEWLEQRFGIEIRDPDITLETFDTLDALAALVRRKSE